MVYLRLHKIYVKKLIFLATIIFFSQNTKIIEKLIPII